MPDVRILRNGNGKYRVKIKGWFFWHWLEKCEFHYAGHDWVICEYSSEQAACEAALKYLAEEARENLWERKEKEWTVVSTCAGKH